MSKKFLRNGERILFLDVKINSEDNDIDTQCDEESWKIPSLAPAVEYIAKRGSLLYLETEGSRANAGKSLPGYSDRSWGLGVPELRNRHAKYCAISGTLDNVISTSKAS